MKKNLCVLWEMDKASVARCEELSKAFIGSPFLCVNTHPHITLGCYENISSWRLNGYVRRFARKVSSFFVQFDELGLLNPERPVCLPDFSGELKKYYYAFHRRFDAYADKWTAKALGLYKPHVSLGFKGGPLDPAAQIRLMDAFSPFEAEIQAISLSWVKGESNYEIIATYPLKQSNEKQITPWQ